MAQIRLGSEPRWGWRDVVLIALLVPAAAAALGWLLVTGIWWLAMALR